MLLSAGLLDFRSWVGRTFFDIVVQTNQIGILGIRHTFGDASCSVLRMSRTYTFADA